MLFLAKMFCNAIFWISLVAGAQTLSIDSQLGTSIEDCFDRILIAGRLPSNAIYRNETELTTRACEQLCKQDKQCQSYDYGVGAKGNATCNLSNLSEKEIKDNNLLIRHPDYDVYIRLIQCEQPAPKPIQTVLNDEEIHRPIHRPIFRPVVEEETIPNILSDEIPSDLKPYESTYGYLGQRRPDGPYQKPVEDHTVGYGDHHAPEIPFRPEPVRPIDQPVSYGDHHAQDIPLRPENNRPSYGNHNYDTPIRPQMPYRNNTRPRPDQHDILNFQGYRPSFGYWRPAPYSPYYLDNGIDYGSRPIRPNHPTYDHRPVYQNTVYHYFTKPNKRPRPGYIQNRPESQRPDPIDNDIGHPYGPIDFDRPYRPKPSRPERPHDYGQHHDNHIYVEIYDPPYRPVKRPGYGQSNDYGTQTSSSYGTNDNLVPNYNNPKPIKPSIDQNTYDKPPSTGYTETQYNHPNSEPGYGNQRPKPTTSKPQSNYDDQGYGISNDYGSYGTQTSSGYGSNENHVPNYNKPKPMKPSFDQNAYDKPSRPGYAENNYNNQNSEPEHGYQRPKPTTSKPQNTYDDQGYGSGSQNTYPSQSNYDYGYTKPTTNKPSSHGYQDYGSQSSYPSQTTGYQRPTYQTSSYVPPPYSPDQNYGYQRPKPKPTTLRPIYNQNSYSDEGYQKPTQVYDNDRPDASYGNQFSGYEDEGYKNQGNFTRPVKPVYETDKDRPDNVPNYIVRPNGDVITSRPVVIGDYGAWRGPDYNHAALVCFRRVLAGKRAVRSHVRRVIACERLEDCRRECATERRFHCESFNYRLDPSFRGKGLCELMTKPIEAFDIHSDFVEDKDFDFYELDRNSLEPNCPDTLKGPGLLHSGYLSSKPTQNTISGHQKRWDMSSYGYQGTRLPYGKPYDDRRYRPLGGRRRYEEPFIPYQIGQIGISRSSDHDAPNRGEYGGAYGYDSFYKNRKDYANSVDYWQVPESDSLVGDKSCCGQDFDYHSLGRGKYEEPPKPYGYGSGYGHWKKGTWAKPSWSGLDYGESNYYRPKGPEGHGSHDSHGSHESHGSYGSYGGHGGHESHESHRSGEVHDKDCSTIRRPGMSLGSAAIRRSLLAQNVVECEAACFNEHEFKCVSYSYRYSNIHNTDNCFLSERPYVGQQLLTDSGSDVYAMPPRQGCDVISKPWVESECFWHVRSGAAISGPALKAALTVTGLGACEAECIRAQGFFCRGFSFRFDSPTIGDDLENCILTASPPSTLTSGSLRATHGHELYARGNYGRGCEPALHDDAHRETQCYLQYDNAAKLIGAAIKGEARVRDEEGCGAACTDAPFRCLSFSYNNAAPPDASNCLLSDVRLFDLQRGVDYEHSADDWLFAFDLFNGRCWRRVTGDRERPPTDLRPDPRPELTGPPSGSGYPGPSGPFIPDHGTGPPSGPSGPPGYLPEPPPPLPPSGHGFKPSFPPPEPGFKPPISRPDYPAAGFKPGPSGPSYKPQEPPYLPRPEYPPVKPGYPLVRPEYPPVKPGYPLVRPEYSPVKPGYGDGKPGYLPEPGYGPERQPPAYLPGDKGHEPILVSWRHYTVSGFPCRSGSACAQNTATGHWACEPEGGEIGSWDYCCAPSHRCGYSEGFHKPWCYVGPEHDQWRPCSDKYYPYHQHNFPHPSHGGRVPDERPHHHKPSRPWSSRPEGPGQPYLPEDQMRRPGPYLPESDRQYWDNLYKNGPQAYYDQYGNPLPGYSKVPTQDRPYIRYQHNQGPVGSTSQWQPISSPDHDDGLDPPIPGGLGVARYWPVAYLHKGPPPNITYFRYNETDQTTTENYLPKERPRTNFIDKNKNKNTGKAEGRVLEDDDRIMNLTDDKTEIIFNITTTTQKNKVAENVKKIQDLEEKTVNITKTDKPEDKQEDSDEVKGISGKLDDFSSSIEILDIEDAKKGEKQSGEKTLEAEERQIEAIGRLLASRRGGKLLLEKRSEKDLESQNIALDKDLINFDFGNKFPTDRKGTIQKVTKEELEKDNYSDKSLEVSETTYVRPPRVLSTTENIRKALVNGKIFYDATIRESTREKKSKQLEDKGPSVLANQSGRKKNVRARNANPVRRVRRLYRRKYNPEEVRRRLLEREKSKGEKEKA